MHKVNNILLNIVLGFIVAMTAVGCQLEKDGPSADRQSVMIELSVSAPEMTKATPTDMEQVINSLHVYAFYGERLAGYASRQATVLGEPFYMDLELPESGTHAVKFYLVANEAEMSYENKNITLTENMTVAQLEGIRFSAMTTGKSLPMYCIQTENVNVDAVSDAANDEVGHEGHFILNQKVKFDLTRPLAKVSVYAAKMTGASTDPQILGIKLLASGTRTYNYLFPQTDDVLNAVPSRNNDEVFLAYAVAVTSEITKGTAAMDDPDNYTPVVENKYLYEVTCGSDIWNVSSGNENEAVLHLEYNLGVGQPLKNAYIYLPEVERNKHIKVCIFINAEGQIIINYVVADWEDNEMPEISFDYPTHSYLRERVPLDGDDASAVPSKPAQMSETLPFVGFFQMSYPENDSWTPTLLGLNASDCTVRVYDYTGQVEVYRDEWPIAASDDWYRIEVTPNEGHMSAGDEVNLAISYRAAGFEKNEFMMINGTDQSFYWPYAGTSQQDTDYVIITMVN